MEKYIQLYLSRYYKIDFDDVGNHQIYPIAGSTRFKIPHNNHTLKKELNNIFNLSEKEIKVYVNRWAKSIFPNVKLKYYWKQPPDLIVAKVSNNLISSELISVQPLAEPTSKLFYLDFQYNNRK